MSDAIAALAARMGILPAFFDLSGQTVTTPRETQQALLAAMGLAAGSEAEAQEALAELAAAETGRVLRPWYICAAGEVPAIALPEGAEWQVTAEDGTAFDGRGGATLPALPLGLHRLTVAGECATIIAAPPSLPLPPRAWGVTLPLSGLRPPRPGGIGDYADLGRVARAVGTAGGDFVGLNPVHAGFPAAQDTFSPYMPSHRRRLNVIHIPTGQASADHAELVDFAAAIPEKLAQLRADWAKRDTPEPAFYAFRNREGTALERFALHQALSDRHGAYWRDWPAELQDPDSPAVRAAARDLAAETTFHAWLQWRAHEALSAAAQHATRAGMRFGLYLDLAAGTHPYGAETWEDRVSFARGVSLGAPPDAFAPQGQSWNLAPFSPQGLVATGFAALAESLRAQFRYAGLIRIDHVLGFERAFWVPEGGVPGAYVQMPRDALLAVIRLEAARAGATVVGEDLGIIPAGMQQQLAASGILGYRLMMFEDSGGMFHPPDTYTEAALASFGNHDLPTWKGWRAGADIDTRERIGLTGAEAAAQARAERNARKAALDRAIAAATPPGTLTGSPEAMIGFLGVSRSRLVAVQAEDLFGLETQANLPGTVREYPNWRLRLPVAPADWADDERLTRTAGILCQSGRQRDQDEKIHSDQTD